MSQDTISKQGVWQLKRQLRQLQAERRDYSRRLGELREVRDADEFDLADDAAHLRFLDKQMVEIQQALAHSKVGIAAPPTGKVHVGSVVRLGTNRGGLTLTYTIVHPLEVDPSSGKISQQSPLGQVLLGKMRGAWVRFRGPHKMFAYRILEIA